MSDHVHQRRPRLRVAIISHDWSTTTGAGRCASELYAVLEGHPEINLRCGPTEVPPRLGKRAVSAKLLRAVRTALMLHREGVQVVVVNTTIQASIVIATKLAGCRTIWWCHESGDAFERTIMRARLAIYRSLADAMVAVSSAVPEAPMATYRIRNVTALAQRKPPAEHEGSRLRILILGTKSRLKGTDLLPEILAPLAAREDLYVDVVGWEDPREKRLLAEVRTQLYDDWGPRLRWLPTMLDVDDAFASASLLVLPSRADTRPRVVEEALARGIPVVASRLPGTSDIADTLTCPSALRLVSEPGEWEQAILASLAIGTSSTPHIHAYSASDFCAAWVAVIRAVAPVSGLV